MFIAILFKKKRLVTLSVVVYLLYIMSRPHDWGNKTSGS